MHIGNTIISAWDTHNRRHLFDVCIEDHIQQICSDIVKDNFIITAMTPALDTLWVGTASGHILVFHDDQLVAWYKPYKKYVCFLTCVHEAGPCQTERCIVASGGESLDLIDLGEKEEERQRGPRGKQKSKMLIVWEAYEAKMVHQIKLIEENSPGYLDTHTSLQGIIAEGNFTDGTSLNIQS